MNKKRKIGILLILIGIGIPLVLFFFQDSRGDLVLVEYKRELKGDEVVLDPKNPDDAKLIELTKKIIEIRGKVVDREGVKTIVDENGIIHMWYNYYYDIKKGFEIPYKYFLALGIILTLIGAGMVIFSFSPKEVKEK